MIQLRRVPEAALGPVAGQGQEHGGSRCSMWTLTRFSHLPARGFPDSPGQAGQLCCSQRGEDVRQQSFWCCVTELNSSC